MKLLPLGAFLFGSLALSLASAADPLPAPWKSQDIGAGAVPGTATFADGAFALQGAMDLWGVADGCHFAWRPLRGDGEIVARVVSMDNPGGVAHAKASLCLRESLDPGARAVAMCVTASDGTQLLYRANKDDKTARVTPDVEPQKTTVPKGTFPYWLKLVRRGNEITGYESLDGETWVRVGKITLAFPEEMVAGLAVSSHKKDVLTKAVFDHVKVSLLPTDAAAKP
jgi:hypothetical protein